MLQFTEGHEIQVCLEAVDMRKSIDGLLAKIADCFDKEAQSKTVFVFCNKAKDKVKLLVWHKNGFVLVYKRLERGRFKLRLERNGKLTINNQQLSWLLAGLEFQLMNEFNELSYRDYY